MTDVFLGLVGPGNLVQRNVALIKHFKKQQVGKLFDVIGIINAVVAQLMAETPDFVDDAG